MSTESASVRRGKPVGSQSRRVPPTAAARKPARKSASSPERPSKGQPLLITKFGLSSLFRICLIFYTLIFAVVLIAMIILWEVMASAGFETKLNHLLGSLLGSSTYHVMGTEVLVIFVGFGIVWILLSAGVTVIGMRIFNMVSELVGGIKVYVRSGGTAAR